MKKRAYISPSYEVFRLETTGCVLIESLTQPIDTPNTEDGGGELGSRGVFSFDD